MDEITTPQPLCGKHCSEIISQDRKSPDVLILLGGMNWLGQSMQASGLVDVAAIYKSRNKLTKPLFKLQYHMELLYHYRYIWYGNWKKYLEQYHTVILFDVFEDTDIIDYIQSNYPKIRIIVYYYNPIYNQYFLKKIGFTGVEIWSFDLCDCKKYRLKYNPQFYFRDINSLSSCSDCKSKNVKDYLYDIIFVGKDKGRSPLLMKLNKTFTNRGVQSFIRICPDKESSYSKEYEQFFIKHIPYETYLEYLRQSKCVLDIVQKAQQGLTLRIMEAIFFNKKIVTNNTAICGMKLYDKRNVYVIGVDNRDLIEFIKAPRYDWGEGIRNQYVFSEWLHRFFDSKSDIEGL